MSNAEARREPVDEASVRAVLTVLREGGERGVPKADLRSALARAFDPRESTEDLTCEEVLKRKVKALDKRVERCLKSLRADGAEIRTEQTAGRQVLYFLERGPGWDEHVSFDARLALKLAALTLSQTGTLLWHEKLKVIEEMASRHMSNRDRQLFQQLDAAVKVYGGADDPLESSVEVVLEPLLEALERRRMVRLEYQNAGSRRRYAIEVSPHSLTHDLFSGGAYLLAWEPRGDSPKQFRLNRISKVEILEGRHVLVPDPRRMENAVRYQIGAWTTGDDPFDVCVRVWGKSWVQSLQEVEPALPECTVSLEKDRKSVLVRFKANHEIGVTRWILQFGACAEVLEPASLRERILEELKETVKGYEAGAALAAEEA